MSAIDAFGYAMAFMVASGGLAVLGYVILLGTYIWKALQDL